MKKYIIYIIVILILICSILYYNKYIIASKDILTKNTIFDIIEEIEDIVICCITKSGNKTLSKENMLDVAVRYLIDNRKQYEFYIIETIPTYYSKREDIYFGRVTEKHFQEIFNKFFLNSDYSIENYKYYNDGYVELNFEPVENISYDYKEYISVQKDKSEYIIDVKYTRKFLEFENEFYVRYIFDSKSIKIKEVTIYNSIMN